MGKGNDAISRVRSDLAPVLTHGIDLEEQWRNPLSNEEIARLKGYQQILAHDENLSVEQARDMKHLAERLVADHPHDKTMMSLLLLASLFLALLLVSHKS